MITLGKILASIHEGQWFSFSNTKNQTYENIIILDNKYSKPTEDEIENKRLHLENEISNEITKKSSGKQKLLDLGLSEDEVKAMIGI